ncbi:hypothetical protein CYMTET_4612, partial [Cymbomonas tetramitiformis]
RLQWSCALGVGQRLQWSCALGVGDSWEESLTSTRDGGRASIKSKDVPPEAAPAMHVQSAEMRDVSARRASVHDYLHTTAIGNSRVELAERADPSPHRASHSQDFEAWGSMASLGSTASMSPPVGDEGNAGSTTPTQSPPSAAFPDTEASAWTPAFSSSSPSSYPSSQAGSDVKLRDWETKHYERLDRGRRRKEEIRQILNLYDGTGWKYHITQPSEFQFGRPRAIDIKSLKAPASIHDVGLVRAATLS